MTAVTAAAIAPLPPLSVLEQVPGALIAGLQQGVNDAIQDLHDPDNYQLIAPQTMTSFLGPLLRTAEAEFFWPGATSDDIVDNLIGDSGVLTGLLNDVKNGLTEMSFTHTGIPLIDVVSTVLFTLPQVGTTIFEDQLAAGNLLDAIGIPIALDLGVAPLLLIGALL